MPDMRKDGPGGEPCKTQAAGARVRLRDALEASEARVKELEAQVKDFKCEQVFRISEMQELLEAQQRISELEAKVAAVPDAQAERVSMEVLNEYRRVAAWLESQAALRAATGDTMHGLAAEALTTLIDHEYSRHTIPLYGILDVWMALHGTSHPGFDEFYDEHGYAEAWARLMEEIRSRAAAPDAATEQLANAKAGWDSALRIVNESNGIIKKLGAERDAALAAIERVRAVLAEERAWHEHLIESGDAVPRTVVGIGKVEAALDGAPEPEEKP